MMKTLYFERDKKRGQLGTYNWLKDELEELCEALNENNKEFLEAEFADIIAWLASLANIENIDLEKAFLTKIPKLMPQMQNIPLLMSPKITQTNTKQTTSKNRTHKKPQGEPKLLRTLWNVCACESLVGFFALVYCLVSMRLLVLVYTSCSYTMLQ